MILPYELNGWQKALLDIHTKFEDEVHYFPKSMFSFDATILDRFRGISYSRAVDVIVRICAVRVPTSYVHSIQC